MTDSDYEQPRKHYLYGTWAGIPRRCYDPRNGCFKYYGGAGITMYPEWIEDSRAFLKWIDENLRNQT